MHLIVFMQRLLDRELISSEVDCLRHLTVQGMAKLNADICQGTHPESTLKELRRVYEEMKRRKTNIFDRCSAETKELVEFCEWQSGRPLDIDELIFINDFYDSEIMPHLFDSNGNFCETFELRDCAQGYLAERMAAEAQKMAHLLGESVDVLHTRLPTTACPKALSSPFVLRPGTKYMVLEVNPATSWFSFSSQGENGLEISPDAADRILQSPAIANENHSHTDMEADEEFGSFCFGDPFGLEDGASSCFADESFCCSVPCSPSRLGSIVSNSSFGFARTSSTFSRGSVSVGLGPVARTSSVEIFDTCLKKDNTRDAVGHGSVVQIGVAEMMTQLVRRPLTPVETRCLRRITAQGIAKINTDMVRGVEPERILTSLRTVYQAQRKLRAHINRTVLSEETKELVEFCGEKMRRALTNEEMLFLHEFYDSPIMSGLFKNDGSLSQKITLEECVDTVLVDGMTKVAQQLTRQFVSTKTSSAVVSVSRMTPTEPPSDLRATVMITVVPPLQPCTQTQPQIRIQLSPMLTWFDENADENGGTEVALDASVWNHSMTLGSQEDLAVLITSGSEPQDQFTTTLSIEDVTNSKVPFAQAEISNSATFRDRAASTSTTDADADSRYSISVCNSLVSADSVSTPSMLSN